MILLEESGLGLAEACNKAGLDPGTVANWRHGKYTPNIFVFSLLLEAMGYELKIGRIGDD